MAQHAWCFPIEPALRLIVDGFEWGATHTPKWNTISISGYHIREAGSTAAQELAFTLADGFTYVERGIARGMSVDDFAGRLSYFWDIHNDFFEEIAKLRAARRIWARHLKERYGAKNPRSWIMRFHSQTAGVTLTAQQPMNNIVRVAYQAMAAVMGGTQSLHTNSMDETLALPTEPSVPVALRTQQVIAYESGVPNVIDPLGGSYYVESLTASLAAAAWTPPPRRKCGITSSAMIWNCSTITSFRVVRGEEKLNCSMPGYFSSMPLRKATRSSGVPANHEPSPMKCSTFGTPAASQAPRLATAAICSGVRPGTQPKGANLLTCSS